LSAQKGCTNLRKTHSFLVLVSTAIALLQLILESSLLKSV